MERIILSIAFQTENICLNNGFFNRNRMGAAPTTSPNARNPGEFGDSSMEKPC